MKIHFYFLIIIFIVSCNSSEKETTEEKVKPEKQSEDKKPAIDLSTVHFMEGTWIDASGTMPGFHEKWVQTNDSLMQIVGFFVVQQDESDATGKKTKLKKGDTLITEAIKVKMIHGNLHYIPKVEGQNNGEEVPYELGDGSTKDSLIFFNSNHDFPQIINYVKKTNDSILVYLSGIGEDKKPVNYTLQLKRK